MRHHFVMFYLMSVVGRSPKKNVWRECDAILFLGVAELEHFTVEAELIILELWKISLSHFFLSPAHRHWHHRRMVYPPAESGLQGTLTNCKTRDSSALTQQELSIEEEGQVLHCGLRLSWVMEEPPLSTLLPLENLSLATWELNPASNFLKDNCHTEGNNFYESHIKKSQHNVSCLCLFWVSTA